MQDGAHYLHETWQDFLQIGAHYLYASNRILCKAVQTKSKQILCKMVHITCMKRDRIF